MTRSGVRGDGTTGTDSAESSPSEGLDVEEPAVDAGSRRLPNLGRVFVLLLSANGFSNAVQFLASVLVIRLLPPREYGLFTLAVSAITTLSLVMAGGITLSMVRLMRGTETEADSIALARASFFLQGVLSLLLCIGVLAFPDHAAKLLRLEDSQSSFVTTACLTAALLMLLSYVRGFFQATLSFRWLSAVNFAYGCLRLVVLVAVLSPVIAAPETGPDVFVALYTLPLVGLIAVFAVPVFRSLAGVAIPIGKIRSALRSLLLYSRWVVVATIGYPILTQLPVFLLAWRGSENALGVFSAGLAFSGVFQLLNTSMRQLTLPVVSGVKSTPEARALITRGLRLLPAYLLLTLGSLAVLGLVMPLFVDSRYEGTGSVFLILGIAGAISMGLGQFNILAHALSRPEIGAVQTLTQIVLLVSGGLLIAGLGNLSAIGMAWLWGTVMLGGEVAAALVVWRVIMTKGFPPVPASGA